MCLLKNLLFLFFCTFSVSACTTAHEQASVVQSVRLNEDDAYSSILNKWTRSAQSFSKFQNQGNFHVTLISEEFRKAYADRVLLLLGKKNEFESVGSGKIGFVVSGFVPEEDFKEYDNRQFWNVTLNYGERVIDWSAAKQLTPKAAFEPYLSYLHKWSKDYLFVFDLDENPQGTNSNTLPTKISLNFKSSLSQFQFEWKQ